MCEIQPLDRIGKLKVASVIICTVTFCLALASYVSWDKKFFLVAIIIVLILSATSTVLWLMRMIPQTDPWKKIDMFYHGLLALILAIGTLIQLVKVIEYRDAVITGTLITRVIALVFPVLNTCIYGYIVWAIRKATKVDMSKFQLKVQVRLV